MTPNSLALLLLGSCSIWLGFPNDFFFLPLIILLWPLTLTLLAHRSQNVSRVFKEGFLLNSLGLCATLYWLCIPIHHVGELPWFFAALAALTVPLVLALLFTLFPLGLYLAKNLPTLKQAFFAAVLWTLLEILSAKLCDFPWVPLTGGLIASPVLVQIAEFVGIYGTSFCYIFALTLFFLPFIQRSKERLLQCVALVLIGFIVAIGLIREYKNPISYPKETAINVLFVEANFDQNQKWTPKNQRTIVERHRKLTQMGLQKAKEPVSLILWSETSMPFFFDHNPLLTSFVRDCAKESKTPLLFGTPGCDMYPNANNERNIYNRAVLLDSLGNTLDYADKEHLVPFGEYIPASLNFAFLKNILQGISYTPGTKIAPLRVEKIAAGILICYEGIFPNLAQKRVSDGANILVDLSNDAWFGDTPAAKQHLYLKALRCIEQNRWLLRATNSGYSAVIDNLGRIVFVGNLFTEEALVAKASLSQATTFFHKTYHIQAQLFGIAVLFALILLLRQRKKEQI